MPPALRDITAVVLAGGQSRRFGSDKPLAQFRGAPLVAHVLRGLARLGCAQVVLVAKEPRRYAGVADEVGHLEGRGIELLEDGRATQTPLAGLAAGLQAARHELVYTVAADMPFAADEALFDALIAAIEGHDAAVPENGGTAQTLCALWRAQPSLDRAAALLAQPQPPGPRALLAQLRVARLGWADPRPFLDADTPAALALLDAQ